MLYEVNQTTAIFPPASVHSLFLRQASGINFKCGVWTQVCSSVAMRPLTGDSKRWTMKINEARAHIRNIHFH